MERTPADDAVRDEHDQDAHDAGGHDGPSRRDFLRAGAAGLAAATLGPGLLSGATAAQVAAEAYNREPQRGRRLLLKGGVVLSLDRKVGDFERGDVLIEGKKILAVGRSLSVGSATEIDCAGTIVMPGFINTHHHQYYTIQRNVIPDGFIVFVGGGAPWPHESYTSVAGNIWTAGRIGTAAAPTWDLGRPPYDPEDNYLSELVASLSQITQGITCAVDTSQASHTPEYTDAMINGLMDSGMRAVYCYSGGTNRSAQFPNQPYEYPGAIDNTTSGIGRLATQFFASKDQLVTLGFAGGSGDAFPGAGYTGWELGRAFGARIWNHSVGGMQDVLGAADNPRTGTDWDDVTLIHCVRWQDAPVAQISYDRGSGKSRAWEIFAERGGHASIAPLIEMQMQHGMPPFQLALNHGILPSLSSDVDTNMTPDPFSMMRGAFCIQRALANDLIYPISNPDNLPLPQSITTRHVLEMGTVAGAASCGLLDKVGTLTPGKEADVVVLDYNNLNVAPLNNAPGAVVTMMDTRHVRDVLIAGKVMVRNGQLLGWNPARLVRDVTRARDRVLARINSRPLVGAIPPGNNSRSNPYRPNFLDSCCYRGQNDSAPDYVLRP